MNNGDSSRQTTMGRKAGIRVIDFVWAILDGIEMAQPEPVTRRSHYQTHHPKTAVVVLAVLGMFALLNNVGSYDVYGNYHGLDLVLWLVVVVIIWTVRAHDIASVRIQVERLLDDPQLPMPVVSERKRQFDVVTRNLFKLGEAIKAAMLGDEALTRVHIRAINRVIFSRRYLRLMAALPVVARVRSGFNAPNPKEIAAVLPSHWPTIDELLGVEVAKRLWNQPDWLRTTLRQWRVKGTSPALSRLARLISLRLESHAGTLRLVAPMSPDERQSLARLAAKVGDENLRALLLRGDTGTGPYR